MSFNVKRQLLGAAGAGGGPQYFFAVVETPTDADTRNTIHAVVDSSDNIFVDFDYKQSSSDYRMGLLKFDTGGNVLAQKYISNVAYRPEGVKSLSSAKWGSAIDGSGNFKVVAKSSSGNPVFLTINPNTLAISSSFERSLSSTTTRSGFMDSSGNAYLLGGQYSNAYGQIAKFNSSGSQLWNKTYGWTTPFGNGFWFVSGGTVDSSGNVYLGGSHAFFGYEGVIVKLNSSGNLSAVTSRYTSGRNNTFPTIGVDSSGNVYAVGYIPSANNGAELMYIVKYNSSLSFQWDYVLQYDQQVGGAVSIDFDSNDNVYIAGGQQEDPNGNFSGSYRWFGVYAKFNSSGTLQWQRGLGHTSARQNGQNMYSTIAIDSNDDMILTSSQSDGSNNVRHYIARLPNDGSLTGTYNTTDVKYLSTNYSDRAEGSDRSKSTSSSGSGSSSSSTFSGSDNSVTFSITTETA